MANVRGISLSKEQFKQASYILLETTAIGVAGRAFLFPFERAMYDVAQKSKKGSAYNVILQNLKLSAIYETQHIFFKTSVLQTAARVSMNLGSAKTVEYLLPHFSPIEKGTAIFIVGAIGEGLATSRGEYGKVRKFLDPKADPFAGLKNYSSFFSPTFRRVAAITSARSFGTSMITFCGIYQVQSWAEKIDKKMDSPLGKGIVSGSVAFVAQYPNMIMGNLHTFCIERGLSKPLLATTKDFLRENTLKDMTRGWMVRAGHRMGYYGFVFGVTEELAKRREAKQQDVPIASKKPGAR
jgi:hypothetical protein